MSIDRYTTEQAQRHLASLRTGHAYSGRSSDIIVGRDREQRQLATELDRVSEGGSSLRLVVGTFGSGKSMLLQNLAENARGSGFVVMSASLGPNARLSSTDGDAVRLLTALTQRTSTKARPRGGAFSAVLERYVRKVVDETRSSRLDAALQESLGDLLDLELGFAIAHVLERYVFADRTGDEQLRQKSLRWLRGEYSNSVDVRRELGTSSFIRDADVFRYLRAYATFVKVAGYSGLLIVLDEMENLFRHLNHPTARGKNQEQILDLYNEAASGERPSTMIVFGATPEIVDDDRRGLLSYPALKRRLEGSDTGHEGDSVIRLQPLQSANLAELAERVRRLWERANEAEAPLTAAELASTVGESVRPDQAIRTFVRTLDSEPIERGVPLDELDSFALDQPTG